MCIKGLDTHCQISFQNLKAIKYPSTPYDSVFSQGEDF